tara:strand:- start:118 stop:336 length:219 start_codon:yes stop_codon:yes gene_type:complete
MVAMVALVVVVATLAMEIRTLMVVRERLTKATVVALLQVMLGRMGAEEVEARVQRVLGMLRGLTEVPVLIPQ